MYESKNFSNQLAKLIFDSEKTVAKTAAELNVPKATLYRYLNLKREPQISMVIKIAEYFRCSVGYLVGLEKDFYEYYPKPCPSFSSQFRFYFEKRNVTLKEISAQTGIPVTTMDSWLNGIYQPSIDGAVKLAQFFNLGIDDFLGR